jgi:hypothetical protein
VVYTGGKQLASLIAIENPGTTPAPGNIYTIAGIAPSVSPYANHGGTGIDGVLATRSLLNNPSGIALDASGNIYVSDTGNHAVRMLSAANGAIYTVAGALNSRCGCSGGDGAPAAQAQLIRPAGIAVDGYGNLYIADRGSDAVRVVYAAGAPLANLIAAGNAGASATAGNIYTVAGGSPSTPAGAIGDGALAMSASLSDPFAVTVDSLGNIFIGDDGHSAVRRIDVATGKIDSIAAPPAGVLGLAVDASDNLYYGLTNGCVVVQRSALTSSMTTVAGNGMCKASGDGGGATAAGLGGVRGVVVDGAGNLYILEPDGVRYVNASAANLEFPQVPLGVESATLSVSVADADILNYPIGAPYLASTTPLIGTGGATGLEVPIPFQVVASDPLPLGLAADCGIDPLNLAPGQSCSLAIAVQSAQEGTFTGVASYPENSVSPGSDPLEFSLSATATGVQSSPLPPRVPTVNAARRTTILSICETIHVTDRETDRPATILKIGEHIHVDDALTSVKRSTVLKIFETIRLSENEPSLKRPTRLNIFEKIHLSDERPIVKLPTRLNIHETIHVSDRMPIPRRSTVLNIVDTIKVSDNMPVVKLPTLLNIAEAIHVSDSMPLVQPSTVLNIAEMIHAGDTLTSTKPSTLLNIAEVIRATDSSSVIGPTLLSIAEAIHVSDSMPLIQPSTVLNIAEMIRTADSSSVIGPTFLSIAEAIHVSDSIPLVQPSTVLNIAEMIHAGDTLTSTNPSMILNIAEIIRMSDSSLVMGPTLLSIAELIHADDTLTSVNPSTLLYVADTIRTTDTLATVQPSTLLNIVDAIFTTDRLSSVQSCTLMNIADTLYTTDTPPPLQLSTLLTIGDQIQTADYASTRPVLVSPAASP